MHHLLATCRFIRARVFVAALLLVPCCALAQATTLNIIHHFAGSEGEGPISGLIQGSDGNFYGTTREGGDYHLGSIYKISPSGVQTVLHSFKIEAENGINPVAGLIQGRDGKFYGVTSSGGPAQHANGVIFSITPTGTLTVLHGLSYVEGNLPLASLVQGSDGNFYGTTSDSGPLSGGSIFKVAADGGFTIIHAFDGYDNGHHPTLCRSPLVQGTDGKFYGTTAAGGSFGAGSIFSVTPEGGFTNLYSFGGVEGEGNTLDAGLVEGPDGNFYGATLFGGEMGNNGNIFKVTPTGVLSILATFDGYDGGSVASAPTLGRDGNFYLASPRGNGPQSTGTLVQLTPGGRLTVLHTFATDGSEGFTPTGSLVQGKDGLFYGTSLDGGLNFSPGAVFALEVGAIQPPVVSVKASGDGRAEYGAGKATAVFERTGNVASVLKVFYKVKGSGKAGVDFRALSGEADIPIGATHVKVHVKPLLNPDNTSQRQIKIVLEASADDSYAAGSPVHAKVVLVGGE